VLPDVEVMSAANKPAAIAALLLAGGASSRMGQPKQLLPYQGRTLLRHTTETALSAGCAPVVLVTGAEHAALMAEVSDLPVIVAHNADWPAGMGTSIGAGIEVLLKDEQHPASEAVLILLADQPLVTPAQLSRLIATWQTSGQPAAAAAYAGGVGVPALFERSLWPRLLTLPPASGAKPLLSSLGSQVAALLFPSAAIDVDTPAQYQQLISQQPEAKTDDLAAASPGSSRCNSNSA
jgi:molybdenum cofactor cytidylyltransferase